MSIYVDIEKNLGSFHLDVQFEGDDEVIALLGASGCGKSMTLKCIAGIVQPDRGTIVLDDRVLFDSKKRINLSPQARHTGLLFQNYALFPNMTVLQNIRAGAKREKNHELRQRLAHDIVDNFGLSELLHRYPHQLSGGQQQRVALARILVSDPRILLLDEPFSALDNHLRFRLEGEVRNLIRAFGKTVILVSHNRDEVFRLADKIAVMHDGRIESFGYKKDVFAAPGTKHAAELTGCKNISPIEHLEAHRVRALDWKMDLTTDLDRPRAAHVGIRMHDVAYGDGPNAFECDVVDLIENPFSYTVMLRPADIQDAVPIGWETDKATWERVQSQRITVHLAPERIVLLEEKIL